jgi:hypothetical protein
MNEISTPTRTCPPKKQMEGSKHTPIPSEEDKIRICTAREIKQDKINYVQMYDRAAEGPDTAAQMFWVVYFRPKKRPNYYVCNGRRGGGKQPNREGWWTVDGGYFTLSPLVEFGRHLVLLWVPR